MDPPDAYAPPGEDQSVPYEQMHPILREYRDEHNAAIPQLDAFDEALVRMKEHGMDPEANVAIGRFFGFMAREILPHNRREERVLFPLLNERLLESGEHSQGRDKTTAIDVLEGDHVELVQMSAVVFNFFGLAARLVDAPSKKFVLDAAMQQAKELVDLLRLHIFREDEVVFALAHKLITAEEFDRMASAGAGREP